MSFRKCEKPSARRMEKAVLSAIRRRSPRSADRLMVIHSLLRSRRRPWRENNPNSRPANAMLPASVRWLPFEPARLAGEQGCAGFYNASLSELLPAAAPTANLQQNLAFRL